MGREHAIFDISEKPKNSCALRSDTGVSVTYGELQKVITAMDGVLKTRCLIFCMCRNEPGAAAGYVSAVENGIVPLLLDANLTDELFSQFLVLYKPSYIWASSEWAEHHAQYLHKAIYEAYGYGLWETGYEAYALHPELALLLATSGSTGDPKLVRISRTNLRSNTESICEYLRLSDRERPITTLPMQYTYGLSIINSHLLAGACVLMTTAGYVQTDFWTFFAKQEATSFGGVPYTYEILKKIHLFQKKLPSLKTLTQAGGKLSTALQREVAVWAQEQGIDFYIMYGQTEATARMGYLPPDQALKKPGSMGIAIPGGEFFLIDEHGNEITDPECVGELIFKGSNVSMGYASKPEDLKRGDELHGVLHTGDMAKRDTDGYYYISGRRKRFIKIYGVRVSLDACEQMLRERYPNLEIACAGEDDHMKIFLAWKEGEGTQENDCSGEESSRQEREDAVCDSVTSDLAVDLKLYRKAFSCVFVEKIPKNSAGKILYSCMTAGDGSLPS